jgi:hypothetical protein
MHFGSIIIFIIIIVWLVIGFRLLKINEVGAYVSASVLCLLLGYLYACLLSKMLLFPHPPLKPMNDFVNEMSQPVEIRVGFIGSSKFSELRPCWGPLERCIAFLGLRSGPPCYIFENEKMVDWTTDVDGDLPYLARWHHVPWEKIGERGRMALATQQSTNEMIR